MAKKSPASVLKQKGLIPASWNLRKLSGGQKSWITKQAKTFSEVIKRPHEFTTISAATKRHKSQAKAAGLPVTNNRAVVRTGKEGGRARRRGDKIVITEKSGRRIDLWFANSKNFLKEVEKARKRKLKPNQVWAFHIGNRINNVQYRDFNALMHYLNAKDDWHSPDATEHISLVLITENRRHIIAHHPSNFVDDDDEEFDDF